ncbi:MAG: cation:proton antiporter [Thermodesulfobacteriota bacterium]|nr:cation:proton antiporter [Thermodesulfobacteriota bacterium]
MQPIIIIGIIIVSGFILGVIACRLGLPKITGYMAAGVLLNPELTHFIPETFVDHTAPVTNLALAFITFSVGGTVVFATVRSLGKRIVSITIFEAEFAFLAILSAFIFLGPLIIPQNGNAALTTIFIPLALLLAALASPTDPSAVLAVSHEYHAKGEVTSTIMSVAAFDDILGIINYSISVSVAGIFILNEPFRAALIVAPLLVIAGSVALGTGFGLLLNGLTRMAKNDTEGVLIVLVIGMLALCYGIAGMVGLEALLSTMTMGIMVTNFNIQRDKMFQILERYTEELVFVLFFTISVMHLDFSVLLANYQLILIFVVCRATGKVAGTMLGAAVSGASPKVRKYTVGGLIPQGGIVIGLALVMQQNQSFGHVTDIVINVIIGATIIHELTGPLIAKVFLKKAGELDPQT